MSHFTVLVALPPTDDDLAVYVHKKLDEVLAPYDENTDVPRYKKYVDEASANDYWLVSSMRKDGQLPEEGEVTWPQVVTAYQLRSPNEPDALRYDEDDDKPAYEWATYNPKSKWDWWTIGGRWPARFVPVSGAEPDDVLMPERSGYPYDMLSEETKARKGVDGGRLRALDLQLMREAAAASAGNEWRRVIDRLHQDDANRRWLELYVPWKKFAEDAADQNSTRTWDQAREAYQSQPVVKTMKELFPEHWPPPAAETYTAHTEESFSRRAAASEVPGFAFIDVEGVWHEAGEMGWFGMSSDTEDSRAQYHARVNEAIDALPGDAVLVSIDCHI